MTHRHRLSVSNDVERCSIQIGRAAPAVICGAEHPRILRSDLCP
jgi:hypothetical protein